MIAFLFLLFFCLVSFYQARKISSLQHQFTARTSSSLPLHYGLYVSFWVGIPCLLFILALIFIENSFIDSIINSAILNQFPNLPLLEQEQLRQGILSGLSLSAYDGNFLSFIQEQTQIVKRWIEIFTLIKVLGLIVLGCLLCIFMIRQVSPALKARQRLENLAKFFMIISSSIATLTTLGIFFTLIFEAIRFFQMVSPLDFFFNLQWSPQMALRGDQVASQGSFGAIPIFTGTLMITFIAMLCALPVGLFSAIYMGQYAGGRARAILKPLLEILAGIPTVVYGFFAILTLGPFLKDMGEFFGLSLTTESALTAGLVMGVMIIPFISSLCDDVMGAVPKILRDGSYALGATVSETTRYVIIPAALPGIVSAILLAISRAIGETMIVVMAAGVAGHLTLNPFDSMTTVTVQIVTLLVGDQEFDSPKTLVTFALGLCLFLITLFFNVIALKVVKKYREKYE